MHPWKYEATQKQKSQFSMSQISALLKSGMDVS
jgi:hypothetical protein